VRLFKPNTRKMKERGDVLGLIRLLTDRDVGPDVASALTEIGASAVEPLISALRDKNHDVRRAAARVLARVGDRRAFEALATALKEEDDYVLNAGVETLREQLVIGQQQVLTSKTPGEFDAAIVAATARLQERHEQLKPYIDDGNVFAESLQKLLVRLADAGPPSRRQAFELISNALRDASFRVRQIAVQALGLISGPQATQLLIDAIVDSNELVRQAALEVLKTRTLEGKALGEDYRRWQDWFAKRYLIRGKYYCLGRVTGSRYTYQEGTSASDYNPDNPTGYCTGQSIDVEVVEVCEIPCVFSRRVYRVGEIIEGFWSYGGDNGIVGKPKVGDIVGYFEEPYANTWEKVESEVED